MLLAEEEDGGSIDSDEGLVVNRSVDVERLPADEEGDVEVLVLVAVMVLLVVVVVAVVVLLLLKQSSSCSSRGQPRARPQAAMPTVEVAQS